MLEDAGKELSEVLEFLDEGVNAARVKRAVKAADIVTLERKETDKGFRENGSKSGKFFSNGGGVRWKDELGPKWIAQIEEDHGEVMKQLGYL